MRNIKIIIPVLTLTLMLQGCVAHLHEQDRFARPYTGPVSVGTTFSQVQCEYLELDWKDTYKETLEMNFDVIRLGAYWSRIERKQGVFDFSELDWQLEQARNKDREILLTVGMKAPRWPEYHIPQWLHEKNRSRNGINISENRLIKKHALEFVKQVVIRYSENSNIIAWQVENEPFNRSGPNEWWISEDFLKEEIRIVREIDSRKRPVITNVLSIPNKFLSFFSRFLYIKNPIIKTIDFAEIPALNIYPVVGHKIWNSEICFITQPEERIGYIRNLVCYAESKQKKCG